MSPEYTIRQLPADDLHLMDALLVMFGEAFDDMATPASGAES